MKKQITIFLSLTFILGLVPFSSAGAENIVYSNPENHYSFLIPDGWVEIPKTTIDEYVQLTVDLTGGQLVDYIAGFQLDNVPDFQYPYILIQKHKVNTPSYGQVIKTLEIAKISKSVKKAIDEYSELVAITSFQDPFVDKERNIIFMNIEADVVNVGKTKGLMVMFLGKQSIAELNFYSIESEYLENLSTFKQIIDSFKYEQGYEYNKEEAKKNDPPSIFESTAEKVITGAVIGLIFGSIFILSSILKKKNNKEIKN